MRLFGSDSAEGMWILPSVVVSKENLFMAIDNVESLCTWLENELFKVKYPSGVGPDA